MKKNKDVKSKKWHWKYKRKQCSKTSTVNEDAEVLKVMGGEGMVGNAHFHQEIFSRTLNAEYMALITWRGREEARRTHRQTEGGRNKKTKVSRKGVTYLFRPLSDRSGLARGGS